MRRLTAVSLVVMITGLAIGLVLRRAASEMGSPGLRPTRLFSQVVSHVERFAVDSHQANELYQRAAEGVLSELTDPYAALLVGSRREAVASQASGNYTGLGIQADARGGTVIVISAWPDSPADRAGIRTGDRIIEIDGQSVDSVDSNRLGTLLRGEPGSTISLKVRRPGVGGVMSFTIRRGEVHRRSVSTGIMLESGTGYVAVNRTAARASSELRSEIDSLRRLGARSLVLDLRGNPGGLVEEGVAIAEMFLSQGQMILETRGRIPSVLQQYRDTEVEPWPDMPMVVLVNEGTASAAEIIAGALQDHDRALIIGQPTYGKGSVQSVFALGNDAALRLTTGRWYTPSGRSIQRVGAPAAAAVATTAAADTGVRFQSSKGRMLLGGGGITPDRLVRRDSLRPNDREFQELLGARFPQYRDAVATVALSDKVKGIAQSHDFLVTPLLRRALIDELGKRNLELGDEELAPFLEILDRDLGNDIARYHLGRAAEIRRRARYDAQLQVALAALKSAVTPLALLGIE